jgi:hypothetical protein
MNSDIIQSILTRINLPDLMVLWNAIKELRKVIRRILLNKSADVWLRISDEFHPDTSLNRYHGYLCTRMDWLNDYVLLTEEFIREFPDKLEWYYISEHKIFSEDFLREFQHKVDWEIITWSQTLSEDFLREFHDKVCWSNISRYQKLSDGFIREFHDKVCWSNISRYQKLSDGFIREFYVKIKWKELMYNVTRKRSPFVKMCIEYECN